MASNISMTRLKAGIFDLVVTNADGSATDLTDATIYFHAYGAGIVEINKSSLADGITITDATGGLAQLLISPDDTEDVPDGEHGIPYEFTLVDATIPYEIVTGNLHISQNVGTP